MPIPKRYFHCSQEIVADPDVWAFTEEFGDRSLRTWLQILIYLERSDNAWRLTGDWLAVLSRTVRQSSANLRRQIGWLSTREWLIVGEAAADGSPLILKSPNWLRYNKSRERKMISSTPEEGFQNRNMESPPFRSVPTPILKDKDKKKSMPLRADGEWIDSLKTNAAYQHINLPVELGKMDAWLALPRNLYRQKTKRFILNWLNKIDAPLSSTDGQHVTMPDTPKTRYHRTVVL